MKINYDKTADAAYFSLRKGKIHKSVRVSDHVIVDIDKKGAAIGIEMLDYSVHQQDLKKLEESVRDGIPVEIISGTPLAA
jgi:uncharacterized protein YuzE